MLRPPCRSDSKRWKRTEGDWRGRDARGLRVDGAPRESEREVVAAGRDFVCECPLRRRLLVHFLLQTQETSLIKVLLFSYLLCRLCSCFSAHPIQVSGLFYTGLLSYNLQAPRTFPVIRLIPTTDSP
jgi:hypothetical protein